MAVRRPADQAMTVSPEPFAPTLDLRLVSRRPARLPQATVQAVLAQPIPQSPPGCDGPAKRASIVIATWNNLVYTRLCLESVLANSDYPNLEIVVVDNGSNDGTPAYLRSLARGHRHVRMVFNDGNRGFAHASNQGLALAAGEVLVLLNNDTLVPPGWLARLVRRLDDRTVGLVGPVTNRTCNEAQIEMLYRTYGEFVDFANDLSHMHEGRSFDVHMLAMFCVAMRRDVYQHIGPLDERFQFGMFEDDDYAMRVRAAGYRVVCTEDVFVHHFGQASLGRLAGDSEYGNLFHANRRRFEGRWGIHWRPHQHRPNHSYLELIDRIRAVVRNVLPPEATVIVVSRGDDALLQFDGRRARHFPQAEDGVYAGYYPADSVQAIAHLEALRAKGGDYLLFPSTALWWLEHYEGLSKHLATRYRVVIRQPETCVIFDLGEPKADDALPCANVRFAPDSNVCRAGHV